MSAAVAGILAALAVASWSGQRVSLRRLRPGPSGSSWGRAAGRDPALALTGRPLVWATRVVGVTAAALVVLGWALGGVLLGCAAAVLLVPSHRAQRSAEATLVASRRDLVRCLDLLAATLDAGASPVEAVTVVASAVEGPGADRLRRVGSALRLGVEPAVAWAPVAAVGGPGVRLARAFARAARSGAPLAVTVAALAEDERVRARGEAEGAARRAGVRAVAPLAVCFLPAFLLLGVVPVVAGVAAQVLGGLR